jgi:hexokinase
LLSIANDFKQKIETGLKTDNTEIKALPTYIHPKKKDLKGEAVVFDLGGTNFRAAIVSVGSDIVIKEMVEKDITEMKIPGYSQTDLYQSQLEIIRKLNIPKGLPVGYCFSYPAKSLFDGDAELIKWVKGVNIENMEGHAVGKPLIDYLNRNSDFDFRDITVVNDTITSLFSGLMNTGFDAYVGLIVGTGTNMATFYPSENIPKLKELKTWTGETPVNLESGNFFPPHLSKYDDITDKKSNNPGIHRFEKAVSGMYLGSVFMEAVSDENSYRNLDAAGLTNMIKNPDKYKKEHIEVAFGIYERSAKLVAASLAGLVESLHKVNPSIKRIQVLAEGSLFWSELNEGQPGYSKIVGSCLDDLLSATGLEEKKVVFSKVSNANLIGAAIAALSI